MSALATGIAAGVVGVLVAATASELHRRWPLATLCVVLLGWGVGLGMGCERRR